MVHLTLLQESNGPFDSLSPDMFFPGEILMFFPGKISRSPGDVFLPYKYISHSI